MERSPSVSIVVDGLALGLATVVDKQGDKYGESCLSWYAGAGI